MTPFVRLRMRLLTLREALVAVEEGDEPEQGEAEAALVEEQTPAHVETPDDDTCDDVLEKYRMKRPGKPALHSAHLARDVLADMGRPSTRAELTEEIAKLPVGRYWSNTEKAVEVALRRALAKELIVKSKDGVYTPAPEGEAESVT